MKKIKKIISVFILITLLSVGFIKDVSANSGPPVNVSIKVINYSESFGFDLLIDLDRDITQNEIDDVLEDINNDEYRYICEDKDFLIFLANYQDSEGYVSNVFYGDPDYYYANRMFDDTDSEYYAEMYMNVPKEFKILLYTQNDKIITSELITMSQFDYRLTLDLSGVDMSINQDNVGVVSGYVGNPWLNPTTWFNFILRLVLTLAIEIGILYLFGFRTKSTYKFVLILNIVSQVLLNIALIATFYYNPTSAYPFIFAFIVGEFLVFLIEMIIVGVFVKEQKAFRRVSYSFIANAASLVIGLLLVSELSFLI